MSDALNGLRPPDSSRDAANAPDPATRTATTKHDTHDEHARTTYPILGALVGKQLATFASADAAMEVTATDTDVRSPSNS